MIPNSEFCGRCCIRQDDTIMMIGGLPSYLINKMNEIRSRNPDIWEDKDFDLIHASELEIEQSLVLTDENSVFRYDCINGNKGIYMSTMHDLIEISPLTLLELLWSPNNRPYYIGNNYRVQVKFFDYVVEASLYKKDYDCYKEDYFKTLFYESAKNALRDYCKAVSNGEVDDYFGTQTKDIGRLEKGIEHISLPKRHSRILRNEIDIEIFDIEFQIGINNVVSYTVSIGDRNFKSVLNKGIQSLELTRMQIEKLVFTYPEDGEIILSTDDMFLYPIDFKNKRTSDTDEDFSKLTIDPGYGNGPILFGYCYFTQVIKSFYVALLKCAKNYGITIYNSVQSSFIENFLLGIQAKELSQYPRQRFIDNKEAMISDYEEIVRKLA